MSKVVEKQILATMGMTSVILFFYPETVWEGLLSLTVCKLGTFCRKSRSNLLCQDHGVIC